MAVARPIPLPAPVMMMILFSNEGGMVGSVTWSDLSRCAIEMAVLGFFKEGFVRGKEQST